MITISFLFLHIIHSILLVNPRKKKSQSKWNSNFHLDIFSQWSNNGQVSSIIRNLYRVRQATWLVVKCGPTAKSQWRSSICWYQWKQSCRYTLLFADLSPLFLPHSSARFSAFYQLLPPASGFFLGFLLVYSPSESTYPREQPTRNILVPLPSSLPSSICSRVGRGKLLLFTDSTFLPFLELEWRLWTARMVTRVVPLVLSSVSSFYGKRGSLEVFRNAYARLNVGYVGKRVETERFSSVKVDNSF